MTRAERIRDAVENCETDDLVDIIAAAVDLEDALYKATCEKRCGGNNLFKLRKALEGVFGHDLPTKEDGE